MSFMLSVDFSYLFQLLVMFIWNPHIAFGAFFKLSVYTVIKLALMSNEPISNISLIRLLLQCLMVTRGSGAMK